MAKTSKNANELKQNKDNEYYNFLQQVQKPKMKELWDNKYDEVWELENEKMV